MSSTGSIAPKKKRGATPHVWVNTTYFAEGFPYTLANGLAETMYTEFGASLQAIGLTSLFHLPWNLKFLWAPILDSYGTKRSWMILTQSLLGLMLVGLSILAGIGQLSWIVSALFFLIACLAATQDISIDGYYLEALDEDGRSKYVGYKAMAWKLAALLVSGPLLLMIDGVGWAAGLMLTAAFMVMIAAFHAWMLPVAEQPKQPWSKLIGFLLGRSSWPLMLGVLALLMWLLRNTVEMRWIASLHEWWDGLPYLSSLSGTEAVTFGLLMVLLLTGARLARRRNTSKSNSNEYVQSFTSFVSQPMAIRMLSFVILFRTGESLLQKMRWPFLRNQMGYGLDEYALANGTIGVIATMVATLIGGMLISRQGLKRWILPFLLAQNLPNLLFVFLAYVEDPVSLAPGTIAGIIACEQFGAGLGTAVLMVYTMRCCDPEHKAAHMAIVTSVMSIGFTLAGVSSGFLADAFGFANYFWLSFAMSIPAMVLAAWVPFLDGRETTIPIEDSASAP